MTTLNPQALPKVRPRLRLAFAFPIAFAIVCQYCLSVAFPRVIGFAADLSATAFPRAGCLATVFRASSLISSALVPCLCVCVCVTAVNCTALHSRYRIQYTVVQTTVQNPNGGARLRFDSWHKVPCSL